MAETFKMAAMEYINKNNWKIRSDSCANTKQ